MTGGEIGGVEMTKAATSVLRYSRFFNLQEIESVLDYGAGTLRNALYLADQGLTVYAADLPEQVKALRSHPEVHRLAGLLKAGDLKQSRLGVDLVISTYVFNIIVRRSQRQRYLENVVANLRPGGYLLMELCCRRDGAEYDPSLEHYLHCDLNAKNYTHHDLDRILTPFGFARVSHYYSSHAVAAIYQLRDSDAVSVPVYHDTTVARGEETGTAGQLQEGL
jgi:tellurite methyltransferase